MIGNKIRRRREQLEWSQEKLAEKCGLGKSHICEIETGKRRRTEFESVRKLCGALGLSLDGLIDNDEINAPTTKNRTK